MAFVHWSCYQLFDFNSLASPTWLQHNDFNLSLPTLPQCFGLIPWLGPLTSTQRIQLNGLYALHSSPCLKQIWCLIARPIPLRRLSDPWYTPKSCPNAETRSCLRGISRHRSNKLIGRQPNIQGGPIVTGLPPTIKWHPSIQ